MVTDFLSFDAYGLRRAFIFDRSYSAFISFTSVVLGFAFSGLAGGNDANDISVFSLAVADQKKPGVGTHTQQKEAFFVRRVLLVEELNGKIVKEGGLGHFEADLVPPEVGSRLDGIPVESHAYIVWMKR